MPKRLTSDFKVGDMVVIKNKALRPKKAEVFQVVGVETVTIMDGKGRMRCIHASNIKRCRT